MNQFPVSGPIQAAFPGHQCDVLRRLSTQHRCLLASIHIVLPQTGETFCRKPITSSWQYATETIEDFLTARWSSNDHNFCSRCKKTLEGHLRGLRNRLKEQLEREGRFLGYPVKDGVTNYYNLAAYDQDGNYVLYDLDENVVLNRGKVTRKEEINWGTR